MMVRPIVPIKERLAKRSKLNEETGCIEWQGYLRGGYGNTTVRLESKKHKTIGVHRLAYEHYVGKIPEGLLVCHKCDNRKCINPKHLFLGTYKDNMNDMIAKGRDGNRLTNCPVGEAHYRAKLTDKDVAHARQLRESGFTYRKLAKRFRVSEPTIIDAINRKSWRHVK